MAATAAEPPDEPPARVVPLLQIDRTLDRSPHLILQNQSGWTIRYMPAGDETSPLRLTLTLFADGVAVRPDFGPGRVPLHEDRVQTIRPGGHVMFSMPGSNHNPAAVPRSAP
jgi:hypothetical protein